MQGARDRVGRFMSWCVIAGEVCDLFVACSQAVAVRSETRAGVASVGIGQAVAGGPDTSVASNVSGRRWCSRPPSGWRSVRGGRVTAGLALPQVPQDRAAVSSVLVAQAWQGFPLAIRTGMTAPRLASAGPAGDVAGHVFAAAGCAVPEGAVVDDAQRAAHLPAGGAVGGVLRQELASEGLQAHGDVGVQGAQRWSKSRWCRCPVQSDAFGARHSCQAEAGCRPGLGHFLGSSGAPGCYRSPAR